MSRKSREQEFKESQARKERRYTHLAQSKRLERLVGIISLAHPEMNPWEVRKMARELLNTPVRDKIRKDYES